MLDPKQIAEWSQAVATLAEICPPMWWGLFKGCKEEGFTDDQAMQLVVAFMKTEHSVKE